MRSISKKNGYILGFSLLLIPLGFYLKKQPKEFYVGIAIGHVICIVLEALVGWFLVSRRIEREKLSSKSVIEFCKKSIKIIFFKKSHF